MINLKNYILSYDINVLPESLTLDDIFYSIKNDGIIWYDSKKGKKPQIIKINEGKIEVTIKDINGIH